jgi:RNA polymerase sigma factor (sigma-70 family)
MTKNERDELIINYLPLANKLAWQKNRSTPPCVTIDELKSAAYMGLVDAASRFDNSRGIAFGVYARLRITGEMGDYLRQLNWIGPTFDMMSLDTPIGESMTLVDVLEEKPAVRRNEFFDKATRPLTGIGRRIVRMYYEEDRTLKEIGAVEGISESRVSQILKENRRHMAQKCDEYELLEEIAA